MARPRAGTGRGFEALSRAFLEAAGRWRGCEWPTLFGPSGLDLKGLRARDAALMAGATSGREAEDWRAAVHWLEEVERDAREAERLAGIAASFLTSGRLQEALRYARGACQIEARYRPPVVWQPLLDALEAALRPADEKAGPSVSCD